MTTRNLLRAAGLLMWAFAGIPAVLNLARDGIFISPGGLAVWIGAFAVFGVAFFCSSRPETAEAQVPVRLLAVQTIAALVMNVVLCTGFEVALLVVVAVQLGLMLPIRFGLPWIAAQSVLLAILAHHHMGTFGAYWSIAVVGAEAFAFVIAAMAGRESAARRELEKTNRELEATRESLAAASRDAERLRIARELHDLLGHDLIALHLELETARHLADPKTREPVERAHGVAKGLLADLRKAVSDLREDRGPVDVAQDIRGLLTKVQEPRVHLDAPQSIDVRDAERANTVVRCVQEIVTNTIKHAEAQNLWITLGRRDGRLEVTARDDGRGAGTIAPGNGLSGMRERIERLGGELVVESDDGAGFRLRANLPCASEGGP
jgi:signal transduction histidine kinase